MDKTREQAIKHTVGRIIKRLRESKNWTKTDLGRICGLDYSAIAKWENGISLPPAGLMVELAEILVNGTPNDLYGITDKTTRTDIMNAKIDLQDLLRHNDKLTFDDIPLPEDARKSLIESITLSLKMLGISKKNIHVRQ
jgi:transcriptional regulator with XRE-family HTH domain